VEFLAFGLTSRREGGREKAGTYTVCHVGGGDSFMRGACVRISRMDPTASRHNNLIFPVFFNTIRPG
jgi:hypothetical protein